MRGARSVSPHWTEAELLGCYEILDARLRPADSAWYNVMARVKLTDIPAGKRVGSTRPNTWHLRPLSNAGNGHWKAETSEREYAMGFAPEWSLTRAGDSAAFDFRDGFSGAAIQFAASEVHGDTLVGDVTEHWDFGPPFSHARGRAFAVRRPCP